MFLAKKSPRLPFPASPKLRVVQIGKGPVFEGAESIPASVWGQTGSLRANVLVGPAADLQALVSGDVVSVDHAIFVLTASGDTPINDVFRVVLWQAFGVPVFELLLGGSQTLSAAECDAHDGLHLTAGTSASVEGGELVLSLGRQRKLRTGLSAVIESSECACGMPGPRLTQLQLQDPNDRHQLAASA